MTTKNNIDHLKPFQFKKGVSGNAGGRPKGIERTWQEALAIREYTAKDGIKYKGLDAAAQCLFDLAFDDKGNTRERIAAFKEAFDRAHGKAKQTVNVTTEASAVAEMPRDPSEMTEDELQKAIEAIEVLERVGVTRGDTEH